MPATPYTPREWVEKKLRKKLTTEFIEIFCEKKMGCRIIVLKKNLRIINSVYHKNLFIVNRRSPEVSLLSAICPKYNNAIFQTV